jgi:hypothetical protein
MAKDRRRQPTLLVEISTNSGLKDLREIRVHRRKSALGFVFCYLPFAICHPRPQFPCLRGPSA